MKDSAVGFLKSFREFALKGNVVDLAVAVIIGGAFGKIVTSVVGDIVMPLVNPLIPGGDWRQAVIGPGVKIGSFLGVVVDFVVVAFVLFLVIRAFERFKTKEDAQPTAPTTDEKLLAVLEKLQITLDKK